MSVPEPNSHSFIVKVWIEETAEETGAIALWRGHVVHVLSGERCYFQDFDTMLKFIMARMQWLPA